MFNTRAKFVSFALISLLCVTIMVVSAMFYVEWQGNTIFGIIPVAANADAIKDLAKETNEVRQLAYLLVSFGFTLASLLFCAALSIFAYYLIAASNNRRVIKYIRKIKEDYSNKNKIPKEEIDASLLEIRAQIKALEKDKVKPIKEVQVDKGEKQAIVNNQANAATQAPAA